MRVGRRVLDGESFRDGIELADRALDELASCLRDEVR
jgi:hypothetical protein